jgi:hypothetical protein
MAPRATCAAPDGVNAVGSYEGQRMDQLAPLQNRVLAHAMACDLAPIGRIEYGNQQNPRFGIAALDSTLDSAQAYDWHAMVHGDALPGTTAYLRPGRGPETAYDSRLLDGYRFFVQQFADLLAELDAIVEGPDETALDSSLVVLASDLGEGLGHGHMKMGYVLAGNLGDRPHRRAGRELEAKALDAAAFERLLDALVKLLLQPLGRGVQADAELELVAGLLKLLDDAQVFER